METYWFWVDMRGSGPTTDFESLLVLMKKHVSIFLSYKLHEYIYLFREEFVICICLEGGRVCIPS
jgi:hypothetical protein